ncbi:ABC transporter ATP-binding protein [Thermodesulfobacteriota bacterium]
MENLLLKVDQIAHRFGDRVALAGLSFDLPEGHILSILGPSGCGKTTLLRIIAGLQKPDRGEIWISGRQVTGPKTWVPPQERSVGMIFQNLALWPHLTARKNIGLGLKGLEITKAERNSRIEKIIGELQIPQHVNHYPHTLSVGEQQRVALARALVLRPRLLLLDEPFSHLDWDLRHDLIVLIKGLAATTLFVTHDQHDALAMGGLLAIMREGRLEQMGEQEEILNNPASDFVQRFVRGAIEQGFKGSRIPGFK